MSRKKDIYLLDIIDEISEIESFTRDIDFEKFRNDRRTIRACVSCLIIIGEASKYLPDELKASNSEIPWKKIIGMRNKLVHHYFGIEVSVLWETIRNDIPFLRERVMKILRKRN